jgi:lambda repressor-like predicted transcriptional regulator
VKVVDLANAHNCHLSVGERANKNKMEAWKESQLGHSLSQISEQSGLSINEIKMTLGQATGLTPKSIGFIFHLKQRGLSLEQISQETGAELEQLRQFLTDSQETPPTATEETKQQPQPTQTLPIHITSTSPPTTTEQTKGPHKPQPTKTLPKPDDSDIPAFLYCCQWESKQLHRVDLLTGVQSKHKVYRYEFVLGCRCSELPGGSLVVTGVGDDLIEVIRIATLREYAVSALPLMHTARCLHAAVYHSEYLYVLGGYGDRDYLSECERYVCAESRWEVLPAMPVAGIGMSAVELDNMLYALGGSTDSALLDTVQKLSLDSLTWELMQLTLPQAARDFPCFKSNTQVYLMLEKTLYSFTPLEVKPIKTLTESIGCRVSSYSRGTLYYDSYAGIGMLTCGELTSL